MTVDAKVPKNKNVVNNVYLDVEVFVLSRGQVIITRDDTRSDFPFFFNFPAINSPLPLGYSCLEPPRQVTSQYPLVLYVQLNYLAGTSSSPNTIRKFVTKINLSLWFCSANQWQ